MTFQEFISHLHAHFPLLLAIVYPPVSRVLAGGFSTGRPAVVAVLGLDLLWDNGDFIVWDNDDNIGWEG